MSKKPEAAENAPQIDQESLDMAKAKALLEKERRERATICMREIQEILAKHRCQLSVIQVVRDSQWSPPRLEVVAVD